jgi:hypothetical protein
LATCGGTLRSATPESAPMSMPTSMVVVQLRTSIGEVALERDVLEAQLVLLDLVEGALVGLTGELGRVLGCERPKGSSARGSKARSTWRR